MNILVIGDIVGNSGVEYLTNNLNKIMKFNAVDFCIANGENAASNGKGITREVAKSLFMCGVDVITMGNHTFQKTDINELLEEENIIRPANFPKGTVGEGYIEYDLLGTKICVINACGQIFMDTLNSPFEAIDEILKKTDANIKIVDFHAETTSEKLAMGYYLDGRVTAVLGTHTHIQTADERILEKGTAYITDIGMTGPMDSILGVKKEIIIDKFLTCMPKRFEISESKASFNAVVIEINESNGSALKIERLNFC